MFHSGDVPSPFPFRFGHSGSFIIMVLPILSYSLTLSIFLSMACWLVSCFFTNAFVRDHFEHPYVIAGKIHWLKTFLFRLMGRCLSRKISLYFPKTLHLAFILIETSCFIPYSNAIVCPRYLELVTLGHWAELSFCTGNGQPRPPQSPAALQVGSGEPKARVLTWHLSMGA